MPFSVVPHQAFQSVLDRHRLGNGETVMIVVATAAEAAAAAAASILVTAWKSMNRR